MARAIELSSRFHYLRQLIPKELCFIGKLLFDGKPFIEATARKKYTIPFWAICLAAELPIPEFAPVINMR
jgi:hypothetical protein